LVATATTTTTLTSQQVQPPIAASSQPDDSAQPLPATHNSEQPAEQRNVRRRLDEESSRFDALQILLNALFQRFTAVELGGAGNCLFSVLAYLQNHQVPSANLAAAAAEGNATAELTRAQIADHLEAHTATTATSRLLEPTGCDVSAGMIAEHGSIQEYLDWIRRDGAPGGFVEVVTWVDLFKVHIRLISATMIEGALVEEPVNARNASDDAPTFHIFHQVGRGGVGGHYQFLQPTLLPPSQPCDQQNAAANVVNIATESPS
jgi:hypothetical protein